jgi:hypothetical protein
VSFDDRSTSVAATAVESPATGKPMTAGQRVMLSDDAGHVEVARFRGQSTNGFWKGRLSTYQPLSIGTRWIEIDDARLERPERGEPPPVRLERLAGADPGERYLWQRLAVSGQGPLYYRPPASLKAVIAALVAAGALDPQSPVVNEGQFVADALRTGVGAPYGTLPLPWASLIARIGSRNSRCGSVAVGVVTPPVDGVVIRIDGLILSDRSSIEESGPAHGFEMHMTTSPGVSFAPHATQIDRPRIGWWAEDDRNNCYLGSQGSGSISDDGSDGHGTITYQPALDPLATELRLTPTGLTQRAVITLALPSCSAQTKGEGPEQANDGIPTRRVRNPTRAHGAAPCSCVAPVRSPRRGSRS